MTKEILNGNYVEMTGRINHFEIKYAPSGTAYTRVLLSKKNPKLEDTYDTFAFTFFGDKAEEFANAKLKGETVNIKGIVSVDKYEKDGKTVERLSLIGRDFVKAEYDESEKSYVAVGNKSPWKK